MAKSDMSKSDIFHSDFKAKPIWCEAYEPTTATAADVPKSARVAIIGSGYAGLSAAIELAEHGLDSVVLEANEPGFGGSTRNGGMVSGGVAVGKKYTGSNIPSELQKLYTDAAESFTLVERIITENNIDCEWTKTGRFGGAWAKKHYMQMASKIGPLNEHAQSGAYMLPRERQRDEIASDYYFGGMVVMRAAHLHPAKYYKGLLDLASRKTIPVCGKAAVTKIEQHGTGWRLETARGTVEAGDVVIATNGYTGAVTPQLQRRVVPVGSYIIATEEMPEDLAFSLIPRNKSIYDTRRVLTYYRMSGDRRRLIFGGRAKFGFTDPVETAPVLYQFMIDRFPQLAGVKITHAWTGNVAFTFDEIPHMGRMEGLHYALGCNGSGVAMMTYLGHQVARKIAGVSNYACAFDREDFPSHPLYSGDPRWLLPVAGRYFRTRDWIDRTLG
jgi:glycine/D-amino acid oxidase-like deaminating enzyme